MKGARVQIFGQEFPVLIVLAVVGIAVASTLLLGPRSSVDSVADVRSFPSGRGPLALASDGDRLWMTNRADLTVRSLDMTSGDLGEAANVGEIPGGIAVAGGNVWVGFVQGTTLLRVDPTSLESETIEVGQTPQSLAVDGEVLWVANFDAGTVQRLDATSGDPIGEPISGVDFPAHLATGFGSVWIADVVGNQVVRIDGSEEAIGSKIDVGNSPTSLATGEGSVWAANFSDGTVTRIDPATDRIVGNPIAIGGKPGGIAVGEGFVWVTRPEDDSVVRIDPQTGEWTGEVIEVGDDPQGLIVARGSVWVANQGDDTISKIVP